MRWRRVVVWDVLALFGILIAAAWGIASALGWSELDEMTVVAMSPLATTLYWSTIALLATHLVWNRTSVLQARSTYLSYRVGAIPGRERHIECEGRLTFSIETRENGLAEADAAGRASDTTWLTIGGDDGQIVIDDLSEDDALKLQQLIERATRASQEPPTRGP